MANATEAFPAARAALKSAVVVASYGHQETPSSA